MALNRKYSFFIRGKNMNAEIKKSDFNQIRKVIFDDILHGDTFREFFLWWEKYEGCSTLPWHIVTVKKWRQEDSKILPPYMALFCYGFELDITRGFDKTNFSGFSDWRVKHGLTTLKDVADIFGISKQAVNHWYTRGQLPVWLSSSCLAVDEIVKNGYQYKAKNKIYKTVDE